MSSLVSWWQNLPSLMEPVIFRIGDFPIKWYGLMYIIVFLVYYYLGSYRRKTNLLQRPTDAFHKNLSTPTFLGVFIGGRLGYVLFYNFSYYISRPLEIFLPFNSGGQFTGISGMSFHGGVIGVVIAYYIYCKKHKVSLVDIGDFYLPAFPLGYVFGRLGNFINGELYGRVTDSAFGMYFSKTDSSGLLRHPSQLYEAFFEGILCFVLLFWMKDRVKNKGTIFALYFISYGCARFFVEFLRQPDKQFQDAHDSVGFVFFDFSMGQVLSTIMILGGLAVIYYFRNTPLNRKN